MANMASIAGLKETYSQLKTRMDKAVEDFRKAMAATRTGRASVHMLDGVTVDAYGPQMPLNQVAQVHAVLVAKRGQLHADEGLQIQHACRGRRFGFSHIRRGRRVFLAHFLTGEDDVHGIACLGAGAVEKHVDARGMPVDKARWRERLHCAPKYRPQGAKTMVRDKPLHNFLFDKDSTNPNATFTAYIIFEEERYPSMVVPYNYYLSINGGAMFM